MKTKLLMLALAMGAITAPAQATSFNVCQANVESSECKSYLDGVVDGALMYHTDASSSRLEADSGYESRALKYRAGKRYQEANRSYCADRKPHKDEIVLAIQEQTAAKNVNNLNELSILIDSLLDCQRLK
ncbi:MULTISPECIES: hypothetical protein [Shewanella]|uniref:Uncharacterized protein n=1 Tax=Shewanella japonica TaxID=93973 RepID=A0ABN4YFF0_9GAMM|nr:MULTISPECIES: hypothetical protein [Shewanella]ARD21549.1 hypothetical protein SJ2017_1224 [Shewanella japonica]KPZ68966.1 hypothetical protein AN944_03179 [Shewanella sp. P1-14-1]